VPTAILVEDEPQARKYLRAMIERDCPDFTIIAEAEDGAEGLTLARRLSPDLVITDIRMTGMDGLELAMRLKEEKQGPYVVVVSGYQEFEYARSALKAGVVDYLLKPVNAVQLRAVLGSMAERIRRDLYGRRAALLAAVLSGAIDGREDAVAATRLPRGRYTAAALRMGPPPSRFPVTASEPAVSAGLKEALDSLEPLDIWVVPGRDASEYLFIRSSELTDGKDFENAVLAVADASASPYRTLVFGTELHPLEDLGSTIAAIRRRLDESVVPGRVRLIYAAPRQGPAEPKEASEVAALENRLDFLISESRWVELERVIQELFDGWEKAEKPLVQAAAQLRRLLVLVRKGTTGEKRPRDEELDSIVEEAVVRAADYGELAELTLAAVDDILRRPPHSGLGEDVPAFFASITEYLKGNFTKSLTLQTTCAAFSISQTYLSRLFRRYAGVTFNDYLTGVRIEAAKRLLAENPGMPLKDVSARSGYLDQFYFSRVFKSVVGMPPSEFAQAMRNRAAEPDRRGLNNP
jgi:two-component system, response regulator YesN